MLEKRKQQLISLLIVLPYILGIVWTCLHPVVSIMTGEAKCRGWFTDESSIESRFFQYNIRYQLPSKQQQQLQQEEESFSTSNKRHNPSGMCKGLSTMASSSMDDDNIVCYQHEHENGFELALIEPISGAVTPRTESIVLVIPFANDWKADAFHFAVLQEAMRLSTSSTSSNTYWVAKSILILTPSTPEQSLHTTVDVFLESYLDPHNPNNSSSSSNSSSIVPSLPMQFTTSIIRNLVVLNVTVRNRSASRTLKLLPQGRRGLLPNMDMVFLFGMVYTRASFFLGHNTNKAMVLQMHPYDDQWSPWINKHFPADYFYRSWAYELFQLFYFVKTLAVGPYGPHASALERGIDAITVEAEFDAHNRQSQLAVLNFLQHTEYALRSLNNLHERLHHSLSQYWMPNFHKFVSHSEYLLPNILLLLPLVVRAVALLLFDVPRFDLSAVSAVLTILTMAAGFHVVQNRFRDDDTIPNAVLALIYASIPIVVPRVDARSLHFMICLFLIYATAPLVLAHVSLALPTSLLWTLVVGMLANQLQQSRIRQFVTAVVLLVTWPPVFLIPQLLGSYTTYTTTVYIPAHLLSSTLLLYSVGSK